MPAPEGFEAYPFGQFLPGSLYPVIAIKGTVSPEDLAILEAYIEWSMLP